MCTRVRETEPVEVTSKRQLLERGVDASEVTESVCEGREREREREWSCWNRTDRITVWIWGCDGDCSFCCARVWKDIESFGVNNETIISFVVLSFHKKNITILRIILYLVLCVWECSAWGRGAHTHMRGVLSACTREMSVPVCPSGVSSSSSSFQLALSYRPHFHHVCMPVCGCSLSLSLSLCHKRGEWQLSSISCNSLSHTSFPSCVSPRIMSIHTIDASQFFACMSLTVDSVGCVSHVRSQTERPSTLAVGWVRVMPSIWATQTRCGWAGGDITPAPACCAVFEESATNVWMRGAVLLASHPLPAWVWGAEHLRKRTLHPLTPCAGAEWRESHPSLPAALQVMERQLAQPEELALTPDSSVSLHRQKVCLKRLWKRRDDI